MASADAKRQEERVKLFATALSNAGVASIVASVIGPLAAGRFQPIAAALGFAIGAMLHLGGQAVLHYVVSTSSRTAEAPDDVDMDVAGDLVRGGISTGGAGDGSGDLRDYLAR